MPSLFRDLSKLTYCRVGGGRVDGYCHPPSDLSSMWMCCHVAPHLHHDAHIVIYTPARTRTIWRKWVLDPEESVLKPLRSRTHSIERTDDEIGSCLVA